MQTYLHLLTSLKRFGQYTETVRYTLRERKFHRTFVPGSEKAWKQKGQGAKVPGSELARERKRLGTLSRTIPSVS